MVTKLFVIYYSTYGHVEGLAREIQKGANSVEDVEATLWQVPETLSPEILAKKHAPPKSDVPVIDPHSLPEADGFLFGFPTFFGMMCAQFKAFFDSTGSLWRTQALAGKPAGVFFSTSAQAGGQEETPFTAVTQLAHHGMLFVPLGYTFGERMFEMDQVKGGSPWGAGAVSGHDGDGLGISKIDLEQAYHQGKHMAGITKKLKSGASD